MHGVHFLTECRDVYERFFRVTRPARQYAGSAPPLLSEKEETGSQPHRLYFYPVPASHVLWEAGFSDGAAAVIRRSAFSLLLEPLGYFMQ